MGRGEKLVKNTFILAIGNFLPRVATFFVLPILTEYLTKEEYGTYDLITVLVSLLLPAVTLQIQTAAFRFLIEHRGDREKESRIITNIYAFTIPTSLAALVILYFCLFKVEPLERILICIYFIMDILVATATQVVRGLAKNKEYSVSAILGAAGRLIFAVVFVWILRCGLVGATLCLIAATGIQAFFIFLKADLLTMIRPSLIDKKTIKELLAYSWPMVPNSMSLWVMRVSDRIVVTAVMGPVANAVYSVANKIPSLLTIAQTTFNMAWQENASMVSKDEDAPRYYTVMFGAVFDFMAGVFGLLIATTPILFALLVRGDYDEAYYQMPILFMGMFFFSITGYLGGVYVAYKQTFSLGITTTLAAVCNLVIDISTISFIHLYAASLSTLISYILLCTYRMINVRKFVEIKYDLKRIFIIIAILAVMSGISYIHTFWFDIINFVLGVFLFVFFNGKVMMGLVNKLLKKKGKQAK